MRVQAFDGYVENGQIYPPRLLANVRGRRRVIITVLDEAHTEEKQTNPPDWAEELQKMVLESGGEMLRMEDFPRSNFSREVLER